MGNSIHDLTKPFADRTGRVANDLFLRAWLRAPLRIAALAPSSATTGAVMARLVERARPGPILDLGAGTGAIGQALLAAGLPPGRLIMVEREPQLAAHLRKRFPTVRVVECNAVELGSALAARGVTRLAAVASTLPIIWFSAAAQAAVVEQCFALLGPGGSLLQLTNQPASPLPLRKLRLVGERAAHVWRNLPPSSVWRYRRPA